MRDTFDFLDEIFKLFSGDAELCALLEIEGKDLKLLNKKFRREDRLPEQFDSSLLDFVAFYFVDADTTKNYLVNAAILRLDIYSKYRETAGRVRKRCVQLLRQYDLRILAEGQKQSGISNVYKYRVEFLPLVSS